MDLTQKQLGEKVGRSATEISRFERGERDLYLGDLKALGAALGTDAGSLLNPEDNCLRLSEDQLEAVRLIVTDPSRAMMLLSQAAETMPHPGTSGTNGFDAA
jgi:transcriptional regulator with XRE-family HTH domain